MMLPADGVKRKLDGVVESFPPGGGCECEVCDGEVTVEEWEKHDNENRPDSDDTKIW